MNLTFKIQAYPCYSIILCNFVVSTTNLMEDIKIKIIHKKNCHRFTDNSKNYLLNL